MKPLLVLEIVLRVFAEVGYIKRFNDSLRSNRVERVNTSSTYYLKSRLIQNKATNLQIFINYRDSKQKTILPKTNRV